MEVRCQLPREPYAPSRARHAVDQLTEGLRWRAADVLLVVSELVTNSLRHGPATADIEVLARRSEDALEVEVCDPGSGFELQLSPRRRDALQGGGLGLVIVDALADEWGLRTDGQACMWARFDLSESAG
jgi:anti-sigma regulatory factor (Ser/Thr protein kinase)